MIRALLAKDLRRVWRNPLPWLINLALPVCITALIGVVFGGKSENSLGRIRFAVVDEDNSVLTRMLRGALNQDQAAEHLEPVFLDRAEALRQVTRDVLSAAVIIPTNFTQGYLTGASGVKLELIKNPAQSINPTVLEELMGVVVTALNAVSRNFQSEFPAWRAAFEDGFDYHKAAELMDTAGRKVDGARRYLKPPLVVYENGDAESQTAAGGGGHSEKAGAGAKDEKEKPRTQSGMSGVFAYLLPGMVGMFLLLIAGNAMNDLLRELRFRTFERYQTVREHLLPFVAGKVVFAIVVLSLSSIILLGGGGVAFRVRWEHPLVLLVLSIAYACFAAGLMAFLIGLAPDERRAGALYNVAGMLLGIAGGCMLPARQLPAFLSAHITPLLPSAWFVEAARALQFDNAPVFAVLLKLLATAVVLILAAAFVFQRRFRKGVRV